MSYNFLRLPYWYGVLIITAALSIGGVFPAFAVGEATAQDEIRLAEGDVYYDATGEDPEGVNDPLEPMNRVFFDVNEFLQDYLLRPISKAYVFLLPAPVRTAFGNALDNLRSPVVLANDLMQGEGGRALDTFGRLAVNSTAGVGGLFDVADSLGMEKHEEDFGQTLGTWGVGEGFYLVLPLFGPSSPRDAFGKLGVDTFLLDPVGMWLSNSEHDEGTGARIGLSALDEYSGVMDELEQVKKTSIDYYAAIRSMYRQKRKSEIENGRPEELPPIPDLKLSYELKDDVASDPVFAANDFSAEDLEDLDGQ
ncbi:MAG: VacJ family lipoprotein [Rhodospirillales bacterium]